MFINAGFYATKCSKKNVTYFAKMLCYIVRFAWLWICEIYLDRDTDCINNILRSPAISLKNDYVKHKLRFNIGSALYTMLHPTRQTTP